MDGTAERRTEGGGEPWGKGRTRMAGSGVLAWLVPSTPASPGPATPRALRLARQGSGRSIRT